MLHRAGRGGRKVLRLIAFTDRNPADHKAIGINSITLHSSARLGQTQTQEDSITHWLKSGQVYSAISTAQTPFICNQIQTSISFSDELPHFFFKQILYQHYRTFMQAQACHLSQHLIDTHTHTHIQVMFLSSDPGPEPPGGPASLLWTNRAAVCSTSLVSLRPSPDIVWPTALLTRPPSLPGICRWVTELTFIKGSCVESNRELTVLLSRRTPEDRNLCSTHPSPFPTIKETMKLLSTVWLSKGPLQWERQLSYPCLVPLELQYLAGNYNLWPIWRSDVLQV